MKNDCSPENIGELWKIYGQRRSVNYTLRRYFVDKYFMSNATEYLSGNVIDIGGNRLQKRGFFNIENYAQHVTYVNISRQKRPDVIVDAHFLSFKRECFDSVIFSEVCEHLRFVEKALQEAHRIICRGGYIVITVPFLYRIHSDPYDYSRYTDYMWREMLHSAGFEVVHIEKQGGFYSVAFDFIKLFTQKQIKNRIIKRFFQEIIVRLQHRILKYDKSSIGNGESFLSSFTTGFGIIGKKI